MRGPGTGGGADGQSKSTLTMTREGKVSLLIAEDDPQIRYLVQTAAERSGCFHSIAAAPDGEVAWHTVRNVARGEQPDLIISDLMMPRMTGIDLIRALKRDPLTRHIPVAIITSSDVPNDREDALAAGACAFEPKPQGLERLTRLITSLRHSCCEAAVARAEWNS